MQAFGRLWQARSTERAENRLAPCPRR